MLELIAVLHVLEAHVINTSWTDVLTSFAPKLRGKKNKKQLKKEAHRKHHRKMHRRAVRHLRHMQKVRAAIRQHHQTGSGVKGGFGVGEMKAGEGMNQDILSMAGAAKQRIEQRMHEARRPKNLAAQQQLNALRHRTHASRVRAQSRAADIFGAAR